MTTLTNTARKVPLMLGAINFQESLYALPFAYTGMLLAARGLPTLSQFLWITVAMVSARTVGMSANRVIDRHVDARNPRNAGRHLPSGRLRVADLGALTAVALVVFLFAAWQLNTLALALAPVAVAYLVFYPYTKRFTWAANLLLGWALAIAPSAAWIGVTGSYGWQPFVLSLAVATWAGSFDILYHTQDRDFYESAGLYSVARRFGVAGAFRLARALDVVAVACVLSLGAVVRAGLAVLRRLHHRRGAAGLQAHARLPRRPFPLRHGLLPHQRLRLHLRAHRDPGCPSDTIGNNQTRQFRERGNPSDGALGARIGRRIMQHSPTAKPVVVGITGASGSVLAAAVIDRLLSIDVPVVATASSAARMVWREEMEESFGAALERWDSAGAFTFHPVGELRAPIASGTFPTLGMVIVPCSMATVAAVAHGLADNLVRRAADVCIKERRPLVIVPRESPLSTIHLRNLTELAQLGATILPPEPAFYLRQRTIDDLVDFVAQRAVAALGVTDALPPNMRYEGPRT